MTPDELKELEDKMRLGKFVYPHQIAKLFDHIRDQEREIERLRG